MCLVKESLIAKQAMCLEGNEASKACVAHCETGNVPIGRVAYSEAGNMPCRRIVSVAGSVPSRWLAFSVAGKAMCSVGVSLLSVACSVPNR